ncbi:beta-1,3-galactosyltransferase 5 [Cephus cinctus]|uniref:Hexosyltransferase n=1 Tax=Cephus cinctus TaxID=211228 RepID=A0AAJ7RNC2_CEPCN|nr:beta-1,3-galactosyltransferase 5 [Cephus cinctus]XP_024944157.1 beta-1,3-galactosyltransferase 5 [Cephus cinctus]
MFQFLHLRSRLLQSLILGLVGLTFYAYYRTTVNDIRQFASARNGHLVMYDLHHISGNATEHAEARLAPTKNSTIGAQLSSSLNGSSSHNGSNLSTLITILSTSSISQSLSSASSSTISKDSSDKPIKQISNLLNMTSTSISTMNNASARAIYQSGHTVSIPEKCPNFGKDMQLVIIVMSAPSHVEARTAIRQTWGHFGQRRDVSILFMLGATSDVRIERILVHEQLMYGDVIRGNFLDSYSNLTLKTISTLEWVDNYCSNVRFILKTDDDMFINVPRLLSFISKHSKDKNVIFGRLAKKWKPIRNKKSKYYVSQAQYKPSIFPDFTTGPAYLLSSDVVHKLYKASLDQTYLKLEDVFTTGIVAHKLGIKRAHANEFLNKRISYSPCNVQRGISIHMVKYSEQFDLWKKLLDGKSKCK